MKNLIEATFVYLENPNDKKALDVLFKGVKGRRGVRLLVNSFFLQGLLNGVLRGLVAGIGQGKDRKEAIIIAKNLETAFNLFPDSIYAELITYMVDNPTLIYAVNDFFYIAGTVLSVFVERKNKRKVLNQLRKLTNYPF